MEIHKQFIEVAGYAQTWNDITYIPTEIIANDETCTVKMTLVDANQDFYQEMQGTYLRPPRFPNSPTGKRLFCLPFSPFYSAQPPPLSTP